MNTNKIVANGIENVFKQHKSSIVIGLTGRTGSGCTTAAKILSIRDFEKLNLPSLRVPPTNHEDRKDRIIYAWIKEHWTPFKYLSVTTLILSIAISHGIDKLEELIKSIDQNFETNELKKYLESHFEFTKKSIYSIYQENIIDTEEIKSTGFFLEKTSKSILSEFKKHFEFKMHVYTDLLQKIGNNLRKSGDPYSDEANPKEILFIPKIITKSINVMQKASLIEGEENSYIVIDALRHPYEIRYLNRETSNFFTIAINTTDSDRIDRLIQQQYNQDQIQKLDEIEYPDLISKAKDYSEIVKQNIQSCLEISDIYISNTGDKDESIKQMTKQLVKYVTLMQHPGLVTPTPEERCMQSAVVARSNSGCISRQVGAVVTDSNYSIKSIGWNDVPQGQVPCILRNVSHAYNGIYDKGSYSKYELGNEKFKKILIQEFSMNELTNGRNISFCFKSVYTKTDEKLKGNQVHTRSLHAEENAFLQIAKYGGQSIIGGNLFTTASPCELCAKKAYQLGIKNIFYIDPYPGIASEHILNSGENNPNLKLFAGAVRSAYHRLYEPLMPYKDELSIMLKADDKLAFTDTDY